MINLCSNSVIFIASSQKIDEMEALLTSTNDEFLHYYYPVPNDVKDWKNWEFDHWGTIHDVYIEKWSRIDNIITISFKSYWMPPIEFYKYMENNGWKIIGYYVEKIMGLCGKYDTVDMPYDITFENEKVIGDSSIPLDVIDYAHKIFSKTE